MSRTTLTWLTAVGLVTASLGLMMCRYQVLGNEVHVPAGAGAWKIQLLVKGKSTLSDAKLMTTTPLDFGRQHILSESYQSAEFLGKPPEAKHPNRRQILWTQRTGTAPGPFRAAYEFYCIVDMRHPTSPMARLEATFYRPPRPGEALEVATRGLEGEPISQLARRLSVNLGSRADQAEALFGYTREIANEPSTGQVISAVDCLQHGRGDAGGKSRLLVALLRSRGIPARLVTGLSLTKGPEQLAHYWVEAWVHDQWLPMCPFYGHYGRVPSTYLIFGFGDQTPMRGRHVRDLDYAFLIQHATPDKVGLTPPSPARRLLFALSFRGLPPAERRLVEFLLLLPIAALVVCVYRNIIGLRSFGTFAPALVGLAFRDLHSLPGILVFVSIVLIGWLMRRVLDKYHLLQVPRTAFLLSLVVIVLILAIVAANYQNPPLAATQYVSLFPMVILTGMIERFWTLETEDGTVSSFRTLLGTMVISASIALVLSIPALVHHMVHYPETLGIIMTMQLLIGRYTGYKLSELFRFRDFVRGPRLALSDE